ncbi:ABC transporter permease [Lentibacillus lipolyticus]|nr:ABC transporter permease [Lentibacillus lipolyticus]
MTRHNPDQQLLHDYKRRAKREQRLVFAWQIVLLVSFLSLWELASRMNWVDPLIFRSPADIYHMLTEKLTNGTMLTHMQVTLLETIASFLIGTILGIVMASILWFSERLTRIMDPYLVVMNAMPKVALGPIIIVAIGPGYVSIITMGAVISAVVTTLIVHTAFREVNQNYINVLKSFKASRGQIFKEAVLPAAIPAMISTLKINVRLSWIGVVVGEFLVSREGLGYLIVYGVHVFDFSLVIASLILIALSAALMYKFVEQIEKMLLKHSSNSF